MENPPPPSSKVKYKLSGDAIMHMVYLVAVFKRPKEIVTEMKEKFNVSINESLVAYYKHHPEYQAPIQKIRERWGNDLLHVELASKRRRLEELTKVYEAAFSKNRFGDARGAIFQIQHEVEKDLNNLSLTNYNINIFKDMTVEELEVEKIKSLEKLKILKGEIIESRPMLEAEVISEEPQPEKGDGNV